MCTIFCCYILLNFNGLSMFGHQVVTIILNKINLLHSSALETTEICKIYRCVYVCVYKRVIYLVLSATFVF